MSRTVRDQNLHRPRPVQRVELDEKNLKKRAIAAGIILAIGIAIILYAVSQMFSANEGWQTIEASSATDTDCSEEINFLYEIGQGDVSATAEKKALTTLYSTSLEENSQIFNNTAIYENVANVYYLNRHPNEAVQVSDVLYEAFSLMEQYDNRSLYLAPVYQNYSSIFFSTEDEQIWDFDPVNNPEAADYIAECVAFANDPSAIDLELSGDNMVTLHISEEYLEWCEAYGITEYIDFGWMKNAFLVDAIAEDLIRDGYTHGCLSSYDGFMRNLDDRELSYSFSIYDKPETTGAGDDASTIYQAAIMDYDSSVTALLYLRTYAMDTLDDQHYYESEEGTSYYCYIDPEDGMCRAILPNLVTYTDTYSCAEMLLQVMPYYQGTGNLEELAERQISCVYCRDGVIYNSGDATLRDIYEGYQEEK